MEGTWDNRFLLVDLRISLKGIYCLMGEYLIATAGCQELAADPMAWGYDPSHS